MWKLLFALVTPVAAPHAAKATCATTARHIVDVALAGFNTNVGKHPVTGPATIRRLAQQCQTETWSASELACLSRAVDIDQVHVCRPSPAEPPPRLPTLAQNVDLSCATIGDHMGKLMQESSYGLAQDSVAASVLDDLTKLPAELRAECARAAWPENLRRCYAASTRYADTVACNRAYRPD
ncbi:MAG TPA: hypothetical protein VGM90_07805 [Kofleriaceae bacterium]|jgi:hypothetical protein